MITQFRSWQGAYTQLTRRRFLKATAAGAGAAALIACGGGEVDGLKLDDSATARQPGTVWFAKNDWKLGDETKGAVPGGIYRGVRDDDQSGHMDAIALMSSQVPFSAHMYEMLFARNRRPGVQPGTKDAETPVGALAEKWEIADDGMTVTFKMRQGVKFHNVAPVNGRVMDMDDWKTSQERHLALGVYRADMNDFLDKAEFTDARTMVWKLKFPYSPLLTTIYADKHFYPIQPKELNTDPSLAERTAIGTGFKILDVHSPAITMEYRKHKEYWGGEPFIDRWHTPIIPEYSNRYAQFVAGNITDFSPTARDVLLLTKDAPQTVIVADPLPEGQASRLRFGRINAYAQPWADPRVRIAIQRSINYKGITEFIANKAEFEAAGIPIEILPMTHMEQDPAFWLNPEKGELGKLSENYLYNVAEAKKLNAAAGFNGPIPLEMPARAQRGEVPELEQLVTDSLRASGTFTAEVKLVPTSGEFTKYNIENQFDGLLATQAGAPDYDPDWYTMLEYHSSGRANIFSDPRMDALAVAQRKAMVLEDRWGYLKELQSVVAEVFPVVTGRHNYTIFRFRWPWLHNTSWGETGSPPEGRPYWGAHLHWLDPDMPNRDKRI